MSKLHDCMKRTAKSDQTELLTQLICVFDECSNQPVLCVKWLANIEVKVAYMYEVIRLS